MFCMIQGQGAGNAPLEQVGKALVPRGQVSLESKRLDDLAAVSSVPTVWLPRRIELHHCVTTGMVVSAWARLDNAAELAELLNEPIDQANPNMPKLILRAYQTWQEEAVARFTGDFAFAIFDPKEQTIFAARDAIGVRPLFYLSADGVGRRNVIATSIPGVIAAVEKDCEINPEWVARFTAARMMSRELTPFREIKKVPPAHWLKIRGNNTTISRYRSLGQLPRDPTLGDREIFDRYGGRVRASVQSRLSAHSINGIETSGGLDSSTIVGLAMLLTDQPDKQLHGFGLAYLEGEAEAILSVSQSTGLHNNHIFASEADPIDEKLQWAILGHPAEHLIAPHHYPIFKLAEKLGVTGLLSGFGGDEGVTNYAPNFRREMLAHRRYADLWAAGGPTLRRRARYFAEALYRANKPSYHSQNIMASAAQRVANLPLRGQIVEQFGIAAEIEREAQFDGQIPTVREFSIHMLERAYVSTRTESCSLMAANFGIEYSWPLLDTDLLDLYLAAPSRLMVRDGMGRAFHREAVRGLVPDHRRLAHSKFLGERVPRMPGFAKTSAIEEKNLPKWQSLDPMLQELVDEAWWNHQLALPADLAKGAQNRVAHNAMRRVARIDRWVNH
jgi:asparagine synthase (glutamine-hydrolysing)